MDREIVAEIKKIVNVNCEFEDDKCIKAEFVDPKNVYWGVMRHSSYKKEIMCLVNKLKNLKYLDLRKNRLDNICELDLSFITHLDLSSNCLNEVPDWIKKLNIKFLNLGANNISRIPEWISDKSELEVFKVHKNKISYIPKINSKNMRFLNLYQNKIERIPEEVLNMKSLEFFSWGVSSLKNMPEQIGNLSNLKWLSFVCNEITKLPDSFANLTNIQGMRLSKNKISEVPEYFSCFLKLENISLYHNRINKNPSYIFNKLPNLKFTNFNKNYF